MLDPRRSRFIGNLARSAGVEGAARRAGANFAYSGMVQTNGESQNGARALALRNLLEVQ
jgi:hypothetical protein